MMKVKLSTQNQHETIQEKNKKQFMLLMDIINGVLINLAMHFYNIE